MKSFKLTLIMTTAVFATQGLEAKYAHNPFVDGDFVLPTGPINPVEDEQDTPAVAAPVVAPKEVKKEIKVIAPQTAPAQKQPQEKIIYVEETVYVPVQKPVYVPVPTRPVYVPVPVQPTHIHQHITPVQPAQQTPVTYVQVKEKKSQEITNTQPGISKTQIVLMTGLAALVAYVLYTHVCNQ